MTEFLEPYAISSDQGDPAGVKVNLKPLDQLVEIVSNLDFQRELPPDVRRQVNYLLSLISRVDMLRDLSTADRDALLNDYYQQLKELVNR